LSLPVFNGVNAAIAQLHLYLQGYKPGYRAALR
jgi:hypothetical protein